MTRHLGMVLDRRELKEMTAANTIRQQRYLLIRELIEPDIFAGIMRFVRRAGPSVEVEGHRDLVLEDPRDP